MKVHSVAVEYKTSQLITTVCGQVLPSEFGTTDKAKVTCQTCKLRLVKLDQEKSN